jgi:hypothetical protein
MAGSGEFRRKFGRADAAIRRRRSPLKALLAIGGVTLVLAGYAASSSFAALPMGFGVERQGSDWLGLDGGTKSTTVNGYLNYEQATWVNAHVSWGGLANGSADAAIKNWATQAQQKSKKFLLSIDYHAPAGLQRNDCDLPNPNSTAQGDAAIQSMRNAVHDLYNYPGMSALWGNVQLEIGTEPNQNGACSNGISSRDAQLWYDIVNDVARSAANQGWSPGLGVVSGGVFTNNQGTLGFGGSSVGARTYLEAGIDNVRVFNWEHYGSTNFAAYGVHTAHCTDSDLTNRTKWMNCTRDVNDRIGQVRTALQNKEANVNKDIEVTALIPTQASPGDTARQATQESDTTDIWNGIRGSYAADANYTLTLVIWNHLVDTGQSSFPRAGFMSCANDDACASASTYTGKTVYEAAHNWVGVG